MESERGSGNPPEVSATHVPLKRCRSSLIFNSLILDCIFRWRDKNKSLSQPGATKCQSGSEWRRRRHGTLKGFLRRGAPTSRYRADYALLAVHGDLIVRSKLTGSGFSLRGGNICSIMVSSASSQLFVEEVVATGLGEEWWRGGWVLMIFLGEEAEEEAAPVGGPGS